MATAIYLKNTWVWAVGGPVISGGSPRWDLGIRNITFLNRLATSVALAYILNAPATWTADVPSDNPEINIPTADGDPFVSYNSRVLWGFRRENNTSGVPYTCRYSGIIHLCEDEAGTDEPITHLTAYDPWMWLNSLPVVNADGSLLGQKGLVYAADKTPTFIAKDLLLNAITAVLALNPRNPNFIDASSGHFDVTPALGGITFQQGISVGEAWTQLTDTGACDIVLTPVYEPAAGKLSIMNVYEQAGSVRNAAIFGWDKFPRSLTGISRLADGTQMENVGSYLGAGRVASPYPAAIDAASIAKYGQYWAQKSFPGPVSLSAVALVALADVALRSRGKRTLTIDPKPLAGDLVPEGVPDPFVDYYLGDQVVVWAGRPQAGGGVSFRAPLTPGGTSGGQWRSPQRVYAMPITLDDNEVETVRQLLMTDPNE